MPDDAQSQAPEAPDWIGDLGGRSIVLIGMPGAGKSHVGRRLARLTGLPFVDADEEIQVAAGCTISEMFELYGEPAFRDGEVRVIQRLLENGPQILATGGGAFMSDTTRANIAERGVSVWLRADLDVLHVRTKRRKDRPLLRTGDAKETLRRLLEERSPVYAQADIVVDTGEETGDTTAETVFNAVARRVRGHDEAEGEPSRAG